MPEFQLGTWPLSANSWYVHSGRWELFLGKEEEVENMHSKYLMSNFPFFVPAGKEMELVFGLFIFRGVTRLETFHKK